MAVYSTRKLQLGVETTWGTAVTPTVNLRGLQDLQVDVDPQVELLQEVGAFSPTIVRAKTPQVSGSFKQSVSYQHILYPLAMLFGAGTPTGAGPYVWTFNAPYNAPSNPKSFTAKYGFPGQGVYRVSGILASNFTLSGNADEDLTCSVDFIGRTIDTQAALENLTFPDVDFVSISHGKFYMDNFNATPGTTEILGTLISFELSVSPERHTKRFISSNPQPEAFGENAWTIKMTATFEWNATSKALVDASLSSSLQKQLQIVFQSGASKKIKITMPAILTDQYTLFSDRDGNATVELNFSAIYDANNSRILEVEVTNDKASL